MERSNSFDRFVALRRILLTGSVLAGLGLAATLPPAVAMPQLALIAVDLMRAWFYFCSMLLGASPFLAAGALAAAGAAKALARSTARREDRSGFLDRKAHLALPLFALLFPGCDCSMNACAPTLRDSPSALAAFAIVWGSCCNPLALFSTAAILGPRMLLDRVIAGMLASALTAVLWSRLPAPRPRPLHGCGEQRGFWATFNSLAGAGIASFALAAGVSAAFLAFFANASRSGGPAAAALLGAILSPCSSSDALLARVLFRGSGAQLAFIIAAQCLDVRQLTLLQRSFGAAHAARAFFAACVATAVGCMLANR